MKKTEILMVTLGSMVAILVHATSLAAGQKEESAPWRYCSKDLIGSKFLASAHSRGIAPSSDCFAVDLMSNSFHAPPGSSCKLTFDPTKWLMPGWQFVGLTGSGRFQSSVASGTLVVTIDAAGGFLLRSVRVTTIELIDPGQCEATELTDILR